MNRIALLIVLISVTLLAGCRPQEGDYLPAASISRAGFAIDPDRVRRLAGREVRISGFVDHGNLNGGAGTEAAQPLAPDQQIPLPELCEFRLKARPNDSVGHSFAVLVPRDRRATELQAVFLEDARHGRATEVYVTGRLETFAAPTNIRRLSGLRLRVQSSQDVRLDP